MWVKCRFKAGSLMKSCFKCRSLKPLDEFYVHGSMRDGHLNKCKDCTKQDVAARRRAMPLADVRRAQAACNSSDAGRVGRKRWAARNRPRVLAMARVAQRVAYAVRTGRLTRGTSCEKCGAAGRIEAAHHDYTAPFDITWLCVGCHRAWDHATPKTTGII